MEPASPQFGPSSPKELAIPNWLNRAIRARWLLLGLYVVLNIAWYWVFLSQFDPISLHLDNSISFKFFAYAWLFGIQLLLLSGAPHIRLARPRRRRSMFLSLAAGSAITVLLSVGVGYAIVDYYRLTFEPD